MRWLSEHRIRQADWLLAGAAVQRRIWRANRVDFPAPELSMTARQALVAICADQRPFETGMSAAAIAERLALSAGDVSHALGELREHGYVVRGKVAPARVEERHEPTKKGLDVADALVKRGAAIWKAARDDIEARREQRQAEPPVSL